MKRVFVLLSLLVVLPPLSAKNKTPEDFTVQMRADDFIVMSLNSLFSHNPTFARELGYGFFVHVSDKKNEIVAVGGYFNEAQKKTLEAIFQTLKIHFADWVSRYPQGKNLKIKKKFSQIK